MSSQLDLFGVAAPAPAGRRAQSSSPVSRLDALRAKLTAASLDLQDAEANLSEVCLHLNASGRGIISADWWQGALHLGALDVEFYRHPSQGRYPRRARRWLRKLVRGLHVDTLNLRPLVAELTAQVDALAALLPTNTSNRDGSAR